METFRFSIKIFDFVGPEPQMQLILQEILLQVTRCVSLFRNIRLYFIKINETKFTGQNDFKILHLINQKKLHTSSYYPNKFNICLLFKIKFNKYLIDST